MKEDYIKAKKLGERAYRSAIAHGQNPYLQALDDWLMPEDIASEIKIGNMEIPLDKINGTRTKGRQNAFANNFMPLLGVASEFASKWISLYDSQLNDGIREPIKVYEYMKRFYVLEGNKRVSVARYCNYAGIEADITRIMPKKTDDPAQQMYFEFVKFFHVCPSYEGEYTRPGSYEKIAEYMGMDLEHEWPKDKVRDYNFLYTEFEKIFNSLGGQKLHMTAGDALVLYMGFYGANGLLHEVKNVLEPQIKKLWNEFKVAANNESIDLLETPDEMPKNSILNGISGILNPNPVYTPENPIRVCFIYSRTPENSSWVYGHELGRLQVEQHFEGSVSTVRLDGCDQDEKTRRAIDAAAADQDAIIFTTSPTMMQETLKSAIHYPKIQFFNCSINLTANAVQTYYARLYEVKFLMGVIAGTLTENHKVGYRASYPIYGSLADINAFAQGVAFTDPKAKVYLSWRADQPDGWQEYFAEKDVRVISGPNFIQPNEASRAYGVYMTQEDGTIANFATPVLNWGVYYEKILEPIVNGQMPSKLPQKDGQALNYWWGMSSGAADLILGKKINYETRKMIAFLRKEIIAGRIHPFEGELRSQNGILQNAGAPALSNEAIITMDWLNENVVGSIPQSQDLTGTSKSVVEVAGVENDGKGGASVL